MFVVCLLTSCGVANLSGTGVALTPAAYAPVTLTPDKQIGSASLLQMQTAEVGGPLRAVQLGYVSAVAARGNDLFVIDVSRRALLRVNLVSGETRVLTSLADASTAGLYVTMDLNVYVVDKSNRSIRQLDWNGTTIRSYADNASMPAPVDVTLVGRGDKIVVADGIFSQLVIFNRLGGVRGVVGEQSTAAEIAQSITSIAAMGQDVLVLDSQMQEVTVFDLSGNRRATYVEDALRSPTAMAVDRCARVFVADQIAGKIYVGLPDMTTIEALANDNIVNHITDMWIDGNLLYLAAGADGVKVMHIEPSCP